MNRLFIIAILLSTLTSCVDLEVKPLSSVPTENVFTTKKGLESALAGTYNTLQQTSLSMDAILFADVITDNLLHIGSKKEYRQLSDNQVEASNAYIESLWVACYTGINRANNILVNIDQPQDIAASDRNRIHAETRFIRAYLYSVLVKYYGGVPIRLKPVESLDENELYVAKSSPTEVYQLIIDDLKLAESLINGSMSDPSKATEGAIKALLARVYLYAGKTDSANVKATEVLAMDFALEEDNYQAIYSEEPVNQEIIFQIDFIRDNEAINEMADWTQPFGRFELVAWADDSKTASIGIDFTSSDLRKSATVELDSSSGNYHCNKYDTLNKDNVIVLRLAEMYLIKAEALNELNTTPTAEAYAMLNIIRLRAGLSPYSLNEFNKDQFRLAVLNERRFELAFEGHRLFDLKRSGLIDVILPQQGNMYTNEWLLPIPQSEIDNNPLMEQNGTY